MEQKDYGLQILKYISLLNSKPQETQDKKITIFVEIVKCIKIVVESKGINYIIEDPHQLSAFQSEDIIMWMRAYLNDQKPQVRSNVIKFLRHLITDRSILVLYRQKGLHYFIARSLQRDYKPRGNADPKLQQCIQQEILQALKLIHRWLDVYGNKFPKLLGNALVALAESCEEQLKRYAIITLRVFALNAPDVCGWCGGIRILIESAMDPQLSEISDSIVWTLLYLLNEPLARSTIRLYLDLSKWFSVFTEIDPPLEKANERNRSVNNKFEAQLQLAKKAIISLLKSWQGLIYLGDERQALKSLVQVLRQPIKAAIRNSIYDILKALLSLGNKDNVGVSVANRAQNQDILIGEYKINNLLNNYLVMLVQVLLDCDLFKILVELSGLQDPEISKPAQAFLKDLSALMFNLIPDCHKYTDFLISAANQNDPFLVDLKSWSSEIVNTMGNYAFDNQTKQRKYQISKFLYQCESLYLTNQLGLPTHKINNETVGIIKIQIEQEANEKKFETLIRHSGVLNHREDYTRWSWTHILELLDTFLNDQTRFHIAITNRLLKTLLNYYLPSNMQFVKQEWKPDFIQAKCGYLLLRLLIKDRRGREMMLQPGEGYFIINKSYVNDLYTLIKTDIQQVQPLKISVDESMRESMPQNSRQTHPAQYLLSADQYQIRMIREYMSWIGLFSCTKHGQSILETTGIFIQLQQYILKNGVRDHILIHLIHSLNYGKLSISREFFQQCLLNGSNNLTKQCLDFIRLLYRSELQDFSTWAIDLLLQSLFMDEEIGLKALSVIEEVTQDPENMNEFLDKVNLNKLLHLCQKADSTFMITILSHRKGFEKIYREQNQYLLSEIERWKEFECTRYIEKVEKVMCDALEFVQNEEQQTLFKFPLLLNNTENPYAALSLVYKMPWTMHLFFECEIENQIQLTVNIDYPGFNNKFILIGKPLIDNPDKLVFNANSQFVLKLQVAVGKIMIDNQCKEVQDPYLIRCDANDKKHKGELIGNILNIDKNGVIFQFELIENKLKFLQVKIVIRLGENTNNTIKMPAHIFGELSLTEPGFNLLKGYIDHFVQLLKSNEASQLAKRSALWVIGHIGQSKFGVNLIRDMQLIPELVKMAEQNPILSLRGTCLYTLNMICTTTVGRKELEKFQWISHLNCNSGWLCIPKNIYQFFYIRVSLKESHRSYWAFQDDVWDKYAQVHKALKMNEHQKKLIDTIALMSNSLTYKDADKELTNLRNTQKDIFEDLDVFHMVTVMITFYQFSAQSKNKIFGYFEKMFTTQWITAIIDHPVYQQMGIQDAIIV